MFVSVANGDVMPLKGMIIGNNKTKKKTSVGYRQDARRNNRLPNNGLTHYGHLMYGSVTVCGDNCMKLQ